MAGILSACSPSQAPTDAVESAPIPTTKERQTEVPTTSIDIPPELKGFPTATVLLAGDQLLVAVADTAARRRQGLMNVVDLGELDGMLFVYEDETTASFIMRNTLIPLDIAFFDGAGEVLEVLSMVPCREEPCPLYTPAVPFRWALEADSGSLRDLPAGAILVVPDH